MGFFDDIKSLGKRKLSPELRKKLEDAYDAHPDRGAGSGNPLTINEISPQEVKQLQKYLQYCPITYNDKARQLVIRIGTPEHFEQYAEIDNPGKRERRKVSHDLASLSYHDYEGFTGFDDITVKESGTASYLITSSDLERLEGVLRELDLHNITDRRAADIIRLGQAPEGQGVTDEGAAAIRIDHPGANLEDKLKFKIRYPKQSDRQR
jgi:hypothetical protein